MSPMSLKWKKKKENLPAMPKQNTSNLPTHEKDILQNKYVRNEIIKNIQMKNTYMKIFKNWNKLKTLTYNTAKTTCVFQTEFWQTQGIKKESVGRTILQLWNQFQQRSNGSNVQLFHSV